MAKAKTITVDVSPHVGRLVLDGQERVVTIPDPAAFAEAMKVAVDALAEWAKTFQVEDADTE
jgi:hypothetical protein